MRSTRVGGTSVFLAITLAVSLGIAIVSASESDRGDVLLPEIAAALVTRAESDQIARKEFFEFAAKHNLFDEKIALDKIDPALADKFRMLASRMEDEDTNNRRWLKAIVEKHGWPGKSLVGAKAAKNAWLLVQHADQDREFQQKCLAKMEAMPKGEVDPVDLAYLTDRVLVGTGKKQKYGTQALIKDGKLVPNPIDDEAHVDERRKMLGLETLAEYLKSMEAAYGLTDQSPPANKE